MQAAVSHKLLHPEESLRTVAEQFHVPRSTLSDRLAGRHPPHAASSRKALSLAQEQVILDKVNDYASRCTLLTPSHIQQLAETLHGGSLGKNWSSSFIRRHRDKLSSKYYKYREAIRQEANSRETRQAFWDLDRNNRPSLFFNVDEAFYPLTMDRKTRRVAPKGHPNNGQAVPSNSSHTTVVYTIGLDSTPVPPLVIFSGAYIMESWVSEHSKDISQLATTTLSGWINDYTMQLWLQKCFDPHTRALAADGRHRRVLFLDGAESHVKVNFLEACWTRNIIVVMFPAGMTGKFQPLDVNFINLVKNEFKKRSDRYLAGSSNWPPSKGMFFKWHQEAWATMAQPHRTRSAWRRAGLYPPSCDIFELDRPREATPPFVRLDGDPETPHKVRIIRANDRAVRKGELDPRRVLEKTQKALEMALARVAALEHDLELVREAQALDRATRGSRKRALYPQGELFDHRYQEEHAEELAARKRDEEQARKKRKAAERRKGKQPARSPTQSPTPGPSRIPQTPVQIE